MVFKNQLHKLCPLSSMRRLWLGKCRDPKLKARQQGTTIPWKKNLSNIGLMIIRCKKGKNVRKSKMFTRFELTVRRLFNFVNGLILDERHRLFYSAFAHSGLRYQEQNFLPTFRANFEKRFRYLIPSANRKTLSSHSALSLVSKSALNIGKNFVSGRGNCYVRTEP